MPQSGALFFVKNMPGFIIGTKSDVGQLFPEKGTRVPYTKIETTPCYLLDIKTKEKDGYTAVLLGGSPCKTMKKSRTGVFKKAGIETPLRFFKEIRIDSIPQIEIQNSDGKISIKSGETDVFIGSEIKPTLFFKEDDYVTLQSRSKGKGFQGVVRRHGFAGGPATHGQSDRERAPGSIGQSATPGRVYKGKRMAGRVGNTTTSIRKVKIISVAEDFILTKGFIPGQKGGLVVIKSV